MLLAVLVAVRRRSRAMMAVCLQNKREQRLAADIEYRLARALFLPVRHPIIVQKKSSRSFPLVILVISFISISILFIHSRSLGLLS